MENQSYVKYSAKFQKVHFNDVMFPITDPFIEGINLKTGENFRTTLTFAITKDKSFEEALKHSEYLIEEVIDKIAFLLITNVKEVTLHSGYDDSTKTPILYAVGGGKFGGFALLVISNLDSYFMDMMKLPSHHIQSTYWHDFRLALQTESPVECYLDLYRILIKIVGDEQKTIDKFIQDNEPNVEKTERPNKPGATETVYLRLRNEVVGHRHLYTIPECTRREIKLKVDKLKILVKKAIEQSGRQDNQ